VSSNILLLYLTVQVSMLPHQRCVSNVANTIVDIIPHGCIYRVTTYLPTYLPITLVSYRSQSNVVKILVNIAPHGCTTLVLASRFLCYQMWQILLWISYPSDAPTRYFCGFYRDGRPLFFVNFFR